MAALVNTYTSNKTVLCVSMSGVSTYQGLLIIRMKQTALQHRHQLSFVDKCWSHKTEIFLFCFTLATYTVLNIE